ncbi:unnamed protein product [Penicillium salamii]|nr:unnamed protein product [Penicillium salamii]
MHLRHSTLGLNRRFVRFLAILLVITFSGWALLHLDTQRGVVAHSSYHRWALKRSSTLSTIHNIYDHSIQPITTTIFVGHTGKRFWLGEPLRFTEPLGRRILILDAESRKMNEHQGLLSDTPLNANELPHDTSGRLNHFMYAKIHGYDYRLVVMPRTDGRFGTWSKVTAMKEALQHYDFVVFLDADAMLLYPNLPMEWLFNYWDITENNLVALALDPDAPHNRDWNGRTMLNTGFMIAQRSPRTNELFEAWESCPTETRYPGCSKFGREWAHEQSAFGNHVRYDFNRSEDIKVLPCAEANGCPQVATTGCVGELVRHYWGDKKALTAAAGDAVLRYFLPQLHELFYQHRDTLVINRTEREFA